jgi:hypothetical protein
MKITHKHLCPACRVERPSWEVKGAGKIKQDYASRRPVGLSAAPAELRQILKAAPRAEAGVAIEPAGPTYVTLDLMDRCEDCGQGMIGQLLVDYDEAGQTAVLVDIVDSLSRYTKVEQAVVAAKMQRMLDQGRKGMSE